MTTPFIGEADALMAAKSWYEKKKEFTNKIQLEDCFAVLDYDNTIFFHIQDQYSTQLLNDCQAYL